MSNADNISVLVPAAPVPVREPTPLIQEVARRLKAALDALVPSYTNSDGEASAACLSTFAMLTVELSTIYNNTLGIARKGAGE